MMGAQASAGSRITALDGLRGALACVVLADHVGLILGSHILDWPAKVSVWAFFAMSGLVLTRTYDGHLLTFLIRRAVRLWPVYALCLTCGYATMGEAPDWRVLAWLPPDCANVEWFRADVPAWSLQSRRWRCCSCR
jgi:peptidoglycan/LPS O-acetylase OafA/YrhL